MKFLFLIFLALFNIACSSCTTAIQNIKTPKEICGQSYQAMARIENEGSHCSGFHIGRGLFITAAHCIEDKPPVVFTAQGRFTTSVIINDKNRDIAVLDTEFTGPSLEFADIPPIGEQLMVIGFPHFLPKNLTFEVGYLKAYEFQDDTVFLISTEMAYKGYSGGPLLDEQGKVIGIAHKVIPIQITYSEEDFDSKTHSHKEISKFVSIRTIKELIE